MAVSCWSCLTIEPDFPITPPLIEVGQRRRKRTWPVGTFKGGGGRLKRLEGPPLAVKGGVEVCMERFG